MIQEMSFKDISYLLGRVKSFSDFGRRHFCDIILNLDQWFRRCRSKYFLIRAMAASLFSGAEPLVLFWKRTS